MYKMIALGTALQANNCIKMWIIMNNFNHIINNHQILTMHHLTSEDQSR